MSISIEALARREFLAGSAAVAAATALPSGLAAAEGKKTFTILHTNDMHSAFIGMGPSADYTPFTLNDDTTRGGYARLAGLIAQEKAGAQELRGPCWCSTPATTAWEPRSARPAARRPANCSSCR